MNSIQRNNHHPESDYRGDSYILHYYKVLHSWFSTCGSRPPQGCISGICIMIHNRQNCSYKIAINNFMVGGIVITRGTVLKGRSIRKVEDH